jgi:hypothetical protein
VKENNETMKGTIQNKLATIINGINNSKNLPIPFKLFKPFVKTRYSKYSKPGIKNSATTYGKPVQPALKIKEHKPINNEYFKYFFEFKPLIKNAKNKGATAYDINVVVCPNRHIFKVYKLNI